MYDSVKKLAISGILKERKHLDPPGLKRELFLRIYGNDFSATDRERIMKKILNVQSDMDSEAAGQLPCSKNSPKRLSPRLNSPEVSGIQQGGRKNEIKKTHRCIIFTPEGF